MTEADRTSSGRRTASPYRPDLASAVRGDLDWIVMKCLEKDRARRYETANGLAADIQRHLNHEPVTARPPSGMYLLQKLAQRNRGALIAMATVLVVLLVAVLRLALSNARIRRRTKQEGRRLARARARRWRPRAVSNGRASNSSFRSKARLRRVATAARWDNGWKASPRWLKQPASSPRRKSGTTPSPPWRCLIFIAGPSGGWNARLQSRSTFDANYERYARP